MNCDTFDWFGFSAEIFDQTLGFQVAPSLCFDPSNYQRIRIVVGRRSQIFSVERIVRKTPDHKIDELQRREVASRGRRVRLPPSKVFGRSRYVVDEISDRHCSNEKRSFLPFSGKNQYWVWTTFSYLERTWKDRNFDVDFDCSNVDRKEKRVRKEFLQKHDRIKADSEHLASESTCGSNIVRTWKIFRTKLRRTNYVNYCRPIETSETQIWSFWPMCSSSVVRHQFAQPCKKKI